MTDDRWRTPNDGKSSYCLWQGLLKRISKCEYLLVMYRINMLHYISISLISKGDNGKSYLSFNSLGKSYLSFNSLGKSYLSFNRGEYFLEINQSETRIAYGGHA